MDLGLTGRTYVVTGGSRGLGLAGEAGVAQVVRGLLADFDLTAGMCGAATLADVGPPLVVPVAA